MKFIAITFVVLSATASSAIAGEETLIRFNSSARVNSAVITLADIAVVYNSDSVLQQKLNRLVVGPAPSPGTSVRVSFSSIRRQLRDRGLDLTRVKFSGAGVVSVSSISRPKQLPKIAQVGTARYQQQRQTHAERAVSKAIQQYLKQAVPELGMISLRVRIPAADIPAVLSAVNSGYEVRGGKSPWHLMQLFQIRFLDRQKKVNSVFVRALIERHPHVLAAKHTIPKGQMVRTADLIWKQVDQVKKGDFTTVEQALGLETIRTIRKVPLVRSNSIVTVYSRRGGITVRRQMRARGNAAAGETITLVSLKGRDSIVGKVIGRDLPPIVVPA